MVALAHVVSRPRRISSRLETLKWVGFLLMFVHHYFRFVLDDLPYVVESVGTAVFPLFTFSLALAIGRLDADRLASVGVRMCIFAVCAFAAQLLVRDPLPINVLLTFGVSVLAFYWWVRSSGSLVGLGLALVVGFFGEYSIIGVLFVFSALVAARSDDKTLWIIPLALLLPQSVFHHLNPWVLASPLLIGLIWLLPLPIPRVRGVFYIGYLIQWPVLWVLVNVR